MHETKSVVLAALSAALPADKTDEIIAKLHDGLDVQFEELQLDSLPLGDKSSILSSLARATFQAL